jgi:hypothetical protein
MNRQFVQDKFKHHSSRMNPPRARARVFLLTTNFQSSANSSRTKLQRTNSRLPVNSFSSASYASLARHPCGTLSVAGHEPAGTYLFVEDELPISKQFLGQFVQDQAPEHGLFVEDVLQMRRQFVPVKALGDELQMPKTFIHDKFFEHGLFVEDDPLMPRQIVRDKVLDKRSMLRDFVIYKSLWHLKLVRKGFYFSNCLANCLNIWSSSSEA